MVLLAVVACRDSSTVGTPAADALGARPLSSLTAVEVDEACAASRQRAGAAGQQTVLDGVCTMVGLQQAATAGDGAAAACRTAVDRCRDHRPSELDCKLKAMDLTQCEATVAQGQACETAMLAAIAKLVVGDACEGVDAAVASERLAKFNKLNQLAACAPLMACSRR